MMKNSILRIMSADFYQRYIGTYLLRRENRNFNGKEER